MDYYALLYYKQTASIDKQFTIIIFKWHSLWSNDTFYETLWSMISVVKSTGFRKRWQKPQIQESQVVNVFLLACFWDYRRTRTTDTLLDIVRSIQIETGPSEHSTNNITNWCLNSEMEDIYIQKTLCLQDSTFHLEICIRPHILERKYHSVHNQSPGSERGCQLYKLVRAGSGYSFKMVIDDLNSFSGVTKINLYHNSSV